MELNFDEGWRHWQYNSPYLDAPVQVFREGWPRPLTLYRREIRPESNIAGLHWRPTGIYRELEERTPYPVRQQFYAMQSSQCLSGLLGNRGIGYEGTGHAD